MKRKNKCNQREKNKNGYYSRNAIYKKIDEISNEWLPPKKTDSPDLAMLQITWYFRRVICYVCGNLVHLNKKQYWDQFNDYWGKGILRDFVWCYKCGQIMHYFHVKELHPKAQKYHMDVFERDQKIRDPTNKRSMKIKKTLSYFRCCQCRYNLQSRFVDVRRNPINFKTIPSACLAKFCLI